MVRAVRAGRVKIYSKCVSQCVYLCFYLESSGCPDNALHTGNALTGSYRTEAVAKQRNIFNATQL